MFEETELVELKREVTDTLKKEIIAFANTNGGKIYIGVDDDGKILGLTNSKQDLEKVTNIIRDTIKPDLTMHTSVSVKEIQEKEIIEVVVLKGSRRPYHLVSKGLKPTGVFIRHGITANPATEDRIRKMIIESDGVIYEECRCLKQELTFEYAKKVFQEKQIDFEDAQKRTLGIINEEGYFTNQGLLLSDQCEHSIKCAIYQGDTKLEFRDRKEFFGSILKQLDDAYEYINMQNKVEAKFEGLNRIEKSEYPEYALREALINSVVHRDYSYSGSILIHIFEDRMEMVSVGGLVNGLTINDILLGVSESRNKKLAACFYRLKLIESYGTGIQRIKESYKNQAFSPEFKNTENAFLVVLPNSIYVKEVGTNETKIISFLKKEGLKARREIEQELDLSKSSVTKLLNKLLVDGKIKQQGKARNTMYYVD